jgi:putative transposase
LDYFDKNNIKPLNRAIGVDLNNKKRFALSTGKIFYGPNISRELVNLKTKQSRVSKDINRRKKMERTNPSKDCQSKRAKKRLIQLQKQYKRIANIEENFIQTTTKKIINMRPKAIVMEDLNVKEMFKNHNIAKNVYHANFYRCIEVMKYKCNKYGIPFMQAAEDYPSSQLCSKCGNRQEMKLGKSTFKCEKCGFTEDRDINAALNLEHLAYC